MSIDNDEQTSILPLWPTLGFTELAFEQKFVRNYNDFYYRRAQFSIAPGKVFSAKTALEAARQTAEHLTQVKCDFLGTMSHEIGTPMKAIIGMSRLAFQTDVRPKQRNHIEKVSGSAEQPLGLINEVLDFSKVEAGEPERPSDRVSQVGLPSQQRHLKALKDRRQR